jgi:xylulokinase
MNAARILDSTAALLGIDLEGLSDLALATPAGAEGLVVVPYLEGERTPNRPFATGAVHGLRLSSWTPGNLARAAFEGMLCGLAAGIDALLANNVPVDRVILIGGASRSEAVRRIAPGIFGQPVVAPEAAQHVAIGAARQAAWALSDTAVPPVWKAATYETFEAAPLDAVRARYNEVADLTADIPEHDGKR